MKTILETVQDSTTDIQEIFMLESGKLENSMESGCGLTNRDKVTMDLGLWVELKVWVLSPWKVCVLLIQKGHIKDGLWTLDNKASEKKLSQTETHLRAYTKMTCLMEKEFIDGNVAVFSKVISSKDCEKVGGNWSSTRNSCTADNSIMTNLKDSAKFMQTTYLSGQG